jgi:hypothetical protein
MRFYETLRGVIIIGFGFGAPSLIIWFLFERLEFFLQNGHNPTFRLVTFISDGQTIKWKLFGSIHDYISSMSLFQSGAIKSIFDWVQLALNSILHLPIELWILLSWPVLSWVGFKISTFMKK